MTAWDRTNPTLRQLLHIEELAGHTLAGTLPDLDRPVAEVVVAGASGAADIPPNALVVAAYREAAGVEADLLVRQAHSRRAVGVVLTGAGRVMLSTRRLAERLKMPLLTLPGADPVHLAWRLSRQVHEPAELAAPMVTRLLRRLNAPLSGLPALVAAVDAELGARSAVVSAEGAVLAGEAPPGPLEPPVGGPRAQQRNVEDGHLLWAPAAVEDPGHADLWLVARIPCTHAAWVDASVQALRVGALALVAWAARQRLAGERDARDRSTLLSELLDSAPSLSRHMVERAVRAGWRLDGWHAGVYIRTLGDGAPPVRLTPPLEEALTACGVSGPLVERADGWASWVTEVREPPSSSYRELTARVRRALEDVEQVDAVAGVGRPYLGPVGIVASLREAREACLFATMGGPRRVEHVDELGVRRVLSDWYRSEAFRAYARTLLQPLLDAGDEPLLETLRTYLELESSAASAAAALHVHRNTVAHRIARVERMLSMSLTRPDERLVLQLACRVLQAGEDPAAPRGALPGPAQE